MTLSTLTILRSSPGIQRDSTTFSGTAYTDGVWCRFYGGMPRKIGGYTMLAHGTVSLVRSLFLSEGTLGKQTARVYIGRAGSLSVVNYYQQKIGQHFAEVDVTPPLRGAGSFQAYDSANQQNIWQFDLFTQNPGSDQEVSYVFAQVAPNGNDVTSTVEGACAQKDTQYKGSGNVFYYAQSHDSQTQPPDQFQPLYAAFSNPLGTNQVIYPYINNQNCDSKADPQPSTPPYLNTFDPETAAQTVPNYVPPPSGQTYFPVGPLAVSGGLVVVGQFLMLFGNEGNVAWSAAGNPFQFPGAYVQSISRTKIIQGMSTRGSGIPSVLFWSLDAVILGQYQQVTDQTSGSSIVLDQFVFNTLRQDVSILSAASVVEFNQNFYWVGSDQFYVYTGIVQTLPNSMNLDWFFNNINPDQMAKVWGLAIPRYEEIWWFYPRGTATECTHAVIYNVREKIWYDTPLARSCGVTPSSFQTPIMTDSVSSPLRVGQTTTEVYGLWAHEYGTDVQYLDQRPREIASSFTTHVFALPELTGQDSQILTRRIEPDFYQPTPSDDPTFKNPMTLTLLTRGYANSPIVASQPYSFDNTTPYFDLFVQGGLVQYRFLSSVVGGNYQLGKVLLTYSLGDIRRG